MRALPCQICMGPLDPPCCTKVEGKIRSERLLATGLVSLSACPSVRANPPRLRSGLRLTRVDPSASPSASLRASAHRDDTTECQHYKPLLSWQWEGSNHVPAPNQNAKGPSPHLLLRKIMPLSTTASGRVGPSAPVRRRGPASFQPGSLSGAVAPGPFPAGL